MNFNGSTLKLRSGEARGECCSSLKLGGRERRRAEASRLAKHNPAAIGEAPPTRHAAVSIREELMQRHRLAAAAAAGLLALGGAALAKPLAGAEYAPLVKISLADARAVALKARPGRITDEELEKEKGGSGLRYSFDVASKGKTYEVGVDAVTGKVLENRREGVHPD
jgi:uncharacterized membrane protein YkoI